MRPIPAMRAAACALLAGAALAAVAQPSEPLPPSRPQPTDPQAAVPPLHYRSSLQRYQPLRETEASDWRQANRRVREAGGWRAYAREAAASVPASASAPLPAHRH